MNQAKRRNGNLTSGILKVMGIFSGVQVVGILCSIVRTKLVAVWIGAAGVGLFGIFNGAIEMISSLCQLGLRNSAVRDLAVARERELPRLVVVVRRWSMALGLLGAVVTLGCAPLLSRLSFGDADHTFGFVVLSVVVFLASLTAGEGAVFQGLRKFRKLARASLAGSIGGLAVSIPMFYFWGVDSVVPSIVAYAVVTWVAMGLYREKVAPSEDKLSLRMTAAMGKQFILLGIFMTASAFVANLMSYFFMAYLNRRAGTDIVGYYQAGFTLVYRYVGLIFTAIAMEYYPRLTAVAASRRRTAVYVGHEMTIAMLLMIPVVTVFLSADELIVRVLYNSDFLVILPYISWAIVGTVLRAVSWCMAFTILARGDGMTFLFTESVSAVISIGFNIAAYELFGLSGLGFAYILWYLLYTVIVAMVYRCRYGLSLDRSVVKLVSVTIGVAAFASVLSATVGWFAVVPVAVVASGVSLVALMHMLRRNPFARSAGRKRFAETGGKR